MVNCQCVRISWDVVRITVYSAAMVLSPTYPVTTYHSKEKTQELLLKYCEIFRVIQLNSSNLKHHTLILLCFIKCHCIFYLPWLPRDRSGRWNIMYFQMCRSSCSEIRQNIFILTLISFFVLWQEKLMKEEFKQQPDTNYWQRRESVSLLDVRAPMKSKVILNQLQALRYKIIVYDLVINCWLPTDCLDRTFWLLQVFMWAWRAV